MARFRVPIRHYPPPTRAVSSKRTRGVLSLTCINPVGRREYVMTKASLPSAGRSFLILCAADSPRDHPLIAIAEDQFLFSLSRSCGPDLFLSWPWLWFCGSGRARCGSAAGRAACG